MNVLVVGGTGFIGRHLCRELFDRGHSVLALSRFPSDKSLPAGIEVTSGTVREYDSIVDAFEGKDVAINLVALSPLFEPDGGNVLHDLVHRQGTEHCVRAAEHHDVDWFVQMSALGIDEVDTHYTRAKRRGEEIVRQSDLEWTITRPSVVFGDGGEFVEQTRSMTPPHLTPLPGGGRMRMHPLYVGDLVSMLAEMIASDSDEHAGKTYEFGGPEILTMADIGRLVREANDQTIRVVPIPLPIIGVIFAVLGLLPFAPVGRDQYRSIKVDNVAEDNDISVFDRSPEELTTLEAYLTMDDSESTVDSDGDSGGDSNLDSDVDSDVDSEPAPAS